MTLIKSISGIRGTIGGKPGDTLNPLDIVKFTSAYATFIRRSGKSKSNTIVVGRDGRISGDMVRNIVCGTLQLPSLQLQWNKLLEVLLLQQVTTLVSGMP